MEWSYQRCVKASLKAVIRRCRPLAANIGDERPLARFQAGLRAVESRIIARNQRRMHPYVYLQPSQIPTSTNI